MDYYHQWDIITLLILILLFVFNSLLGPAKTQLEELNKALADFQRENVWFYFPLITLSNILFIFSCLLIHF